MSFITVHLKKILTIEISIRIILCILFIFLNYTDPFIRYIQPEEMWLYNYPRAKSYVSTFYLWLLICLVPLFLCTCEYLYNKKKMDITTILLSLTLNLCLNGFLTSLIKVIVGRPRPDFLNRCFPTIKGNNPLHCTGDRALVMDGRKSFPSGHSSFAFSSMVFVSLYLIKQLQLFNNETRKEGWKLLACLTPLLIATLIAISRTCDYHHHWEDVLVGSLLGTVIAYITFQYYFSLTNNNYVSISHTQDGTILNI